MECGGEKNITQSKAAKRLGNIVDKLITQIDETSNDKKETTQEDIEIKDRAAMMDTISDQK